MKHSIAICLFLLTAFRLSAQCNPDRVPPKLEPKFAATATLGGPKCMVVVKPEHLLQTVSDNCTPAQSLKLRLRRAGIGTGMPLLPAGAAITFTPADGPGPHFLEVWAADASGNEAFVYAGITVQNPSGCGFQFLPDTLYANVGTPNGSGLEDLTWEMDEISPTFPPVSYFFSDWIVLNNDLFSGPAQDNVYTVTPKKDNDPLNGVSTYDLVLMSMDILKIKPFDHPYKILAADANRDNKISAADQIDLRKLILGIYTELPDNTSWRFLPEDYIFPKPENPFYEAVPESVTFNRHRTKPLPNFAPIKVGDVNWNAVTSSLLSTDDRSTVSCRMQDLDLIPGQKALVPVYLTDLPELVGLQGAFEFDPGILEITAVLPGVLEDFSLENYFQPKPGLLKFSWTHPELKPSNNLEPLFFLEIKALQNVQLSRILNFQHFAIQAEAYDRSGSIFNLELAFAPLPPPRKDEILPAYPNPAVESFQIPAWLAEPGRVRVELFSPDGMLVYEFEQNFEAGKHVIPVSRSNLAGGLYLYRVSAGTASVQGRIVLR